MSRIKKLSIAVGLIWLFVVFAVWAKQPADSATQQFAPGSVILAPEQVQQLNDQTQELVEQLNRLSTENRKLRLMNQQFQQATKKPICA